MVLVEDLLRQTEVDLLVGALVPGKLRHPLQERPNDLVFRRLRAGSLEALQLPLDLHRLLLVQLQPFDPLSELLDVVAFVLVTELTLDLLELLTEQHLPLALSQLFLHPSLDVLLGIEPGKLPLDRNEGGTHPLLVTEHLQKLLLVFRGKLEVERHEVRKGPGLIDALDQLVQRLGGDPTPRSELRSALAELLVQRLEGGVGRVGRLHAVHLQEHGPQHLLTVGVIAEHLGSALTLHQELDATTHAMGLDDPDDSPDLVENLGYGVVHILFLRDGEETPITIESFLYRLDGTGTTCRDRHGDPWIDNRVPQRQDRKGVTLTHSEFAPICRWVSRAGPGARPTDSIKGNVGWIARSLPPRKAHFRACTADTLSECRAFLTVSQDLACASQSVSRALPSP